MLEERAAWIEGRVPEPISNRSDEEAEAVTRMIATDAHPRPLAGTLELFDTLKDIKFDLETDDSEGRDQ